MGNTPRCRYHFHEFRHLEGTQEPSDACAGAISNGIIIACSTSDEGLNTEKSWAIVIR